jgi:hypothetical protein
MPQVDNLQSDRLIRISVVASRSNLNDPSDGNYRGVLPPGGNKSTLFYYFRSIQISPATRTLNYFVPCHYKRSELHHELRSTTTLRKTIRALIHLYCDRSRRQRYVPSVATICSVVSLADAMIDTLRSGKAGKTPAFYTQQIQGVERAIRNTQQVMILCPHCFPY